MFLLISKNIVLEVSAHMKPTKPSLIKAFKPTNLQVNAINSPEIIAVSMAPFDLVIFNETIVIADPTDAAKIVAANSAASNTLASRKIDNNSEMPPARIIDNL